MTIIVIWFAITTILIVGIAGAFVKTIFKLFEAEDELHAHQLAYERLREMSAGSAALYTTHEVLDDLVTQYQLVKLKMNS